MEKIRGIYEKVRGSRVWWVRYTDAGGNKRREKAGMRATALNLLNKRKTEKLQQIKLPETIKRKPLLFSTLMDDALEHSAAENGERTTHEIELKIERMRKDWGSHRVEDITKQDIVRWLTKEKAQRKWTVATMNRWQATFSLIFRVGIDNEKISLNPASRIRRTAENNQRLRFLSPEEESRLVEVLSTRHATYLPAFLISLHTGMRASEQWRVQWADVDLKRKILTVRKQKNGMGERPLSLNSVAINAFKSLRTSNVATGPVFKNSEGTPMKASRAWFEPAVADAAMLDYTWNSNRHTFASRLAMSGASLRTIAALMGHRTIQMTMRYSHLSPEHNQEAVEALTTFGKSAAGGQAKGHQSGHQERSTAKKTVKH